jgi:hypothetical protein
MLLAWIGLAYLASSDLAIDPKSQISNSCKLSQIHITGKINTNSAINTHSDIHSIPSYILVDELVWPAVSGQLSGTSMPCPLPALLVAPLAILMLWCMELMLVIPLNV